MDGYIDWVREHIEEVGTEGAGPPSQNSRKLTQSHPAVECRELHSTKLITVVIHPCSWLQAMVCAEQLHL